MMERLCDRLIGLLNHEKVSWTGHCRAQNCQPGTVLGEDRIAIGLSERACLHVILDIPYGLNPSAEGNYPPVRRESSARRGV